MREIPLISFRLLDTMPSLELQEEVKPSSNGSSHLHHFAVAAMDVARSHAPLIVCVGAIVEAIADG